LTRASPDARAEFARLSNDEQAARLALLGARALAAWGLGDARLDLLKYRENAVFRATSGDAERRLHALRVHRPGYRSDAQIRSEAAWMRALAREGGVPTPAIVPTQAGDVLAVAAVEGVPEPRQCDLLAWVEGRPLGTLERGVDMDEAGLRRTYRTVGEVAARIHAHAARWTRPADFARPAWDAEALVGEAPTFGPFWKLPGLGGAQRSVLLRARDRAREALEALGPADALVHGDLIPDNLLAGGEGVRVIDFDDCGFSWPGLELATSVFPLRVSGGLAAGLASWLEGYRALRPFPDADRELLPTFLVARGLSYLGWPVGRPEVALPEAAIAFMVDAITDLAERYLSGALRREVA
jgi:Ser/Thr protein kinase RdoA (MazF antagonist)